MKNKKGIILLIVVIVLALIAAGFVLFKDKLFKTNTLETNGNAANSTLINLDLDSYIVKDIIEKTTLIKKNYTNSNLSKEELIATALLSLNESKVNVCVPIGQYTKSATIEDINNVLSGKITGFSKLTIEDIKNADEDKIYNLTYGTYRIEVDNETIYPIMNCDGILGPVMELAQEKAVSAKQDNDNIYVYVKVAFVKMNEYVSDLEYLVYKNPDYSGEALETVLEPNVNDTSYITKWDEYNTYKYTFKLVGNKYLFEKFEIEK